jgi:hypothetical protein
MFTATQRLDSYVAPELRDRSWHQPITEDEPDPQVQRAAASLYDPHGNHTETVEGTCAEVAEQAAKFLSKMAADGYPATVIIEPEPAVTEISYVDALGIARDRIEERGTNPEYERGMVNLLADLFPIIDMDTGTRMEQVESDLWNAGERVA